jgi:aerobic-type carbon monoxide dehydrogenase small subunit (CoxS/CutS family)
MELNVNGTPRRVEVGEDRTLLGVLRDELGLTGAKYGCGEGRCGACTVLVDGETVRSCVTRVGAVAGRTIRTIEGLEAADGRLHPLQQAFLDHDALQCGYCTPGMILAGVALLGEHPDPTDEQVVNAMQGNVCRCGTYGRIAAAIRSAAHASREGGDR